MSRAAQPLPENNPEREAHENTGRYAIDSSVRGGGTMIPPADDSTGELLSLEEIGGMLIENKPRTQPPPPPPAALNTTSGVFPAKPADPDAAFAERLISLRPIYDAPRDKQNERAVIEVEDLTLRPDNPYLASSLVPPPETGRTSKKLILAGATVVVVAAAAGLFVLARPSAAPVAVAPSNPSAAAARSTAASKPAPRAEPAQPVAVGVEATAPAVEPAVAAAAPAPAEPVAPAETAISAVEKPHATVEAVQTASAEATVPVASAERVAPKAPEAAQPAAPAATTEPAAPVATAPAQSAPSAPAAAAQTAAAPAASAEALPATLTRGQVFDGFDGVRAALEQCAAGQHGVAKINVTIANTGRVTYALIDGPFAGTPAGSCMARAVRAAKFPSFSQPSLKVAYPVSL